MKRTHKILILSALAILFVICLFVYSSPDETVAPAPTATTKDTAAIRREALDELGDLPRKADSLKKADPATYDDDYRAKHNIN